MLPLTFANPADYDKIQPSDRISLIGLKNLEPGKVRNENCFVRHSQETLKQFIIREGGRDVDRRYYGEKDIFQLRFYCCI